LGKPEKRTARCSGLKSHAWTARHERVKKKPLGMKKKHDKGKRKPGGGLAYEKES